MREGVREDPHQLWRGTHYELAGVQLGSSFFRLISQHETLTVYHGQRGLLHPFRLAIAAMSLFMDGEYSQPAILCLAPGIR